MSYSSKISYEDRWQKHLLKALAIHGDRYDYSLVKAVKSNKDYIQIICKVHGVFNQGVSSHINAKQGCPRCNGNFRKSLSEVISEANKVHNNKYQYKTDFYKNNKQRFDIICPKHGEFNQNIKEHLYGFGCPKCSKFCRDTETFKERVTKIHGNKYNYSRVKYKKNHIPVTIICKKHGPFLQTPHGHLAGYGCKRCVQNSSKIENAWLDTFNNSNILRQHRLRINGKVFSLDGFDPTTNTVYEFHGSMFHGHPSYYNPWDLCPLSKDYFFNIFVKTERKEKKIRDGGYNLVTMWEHDWYKNQGKPYKVSSIKPNNEGRLVYFRHIDDLNMTGPFYD